MSELLHVDGSKGGGSLVRNAIALSLITEKPFHIDSIRENRDSPGLKPQHYKSIVLAKNVSSSKVVNHRKGSREIEFYPGQMKNSNTSIDIGTAGSISLCLQSVMLPAIIKGKKLNMTVTGGTDVKFSPSVDFLNKVYLHTFRNICDYEVNVEVRGYYPEGGGRASVTIDGDGEGFSPLRKDTVGSPIYVRGVSHASSDLQKKEVAERQKKAVEILLSDVDARVDIQAVYSKSKSTGSGVTVWVLAGDSSKRVVGSFVPGEKGVKSEDVGEKAAKRVRKMVESDELDTYLLDQHILPLALFGGVVRSHSVDNHARANMYLCRKFLDTTFTEDNGEVRVNNPFLSMH